MAPDDPQDVVDVAIWRVEGAVGDLDPPAYMTAGAAGCDLAAALEAPLVLAPLGRALVPTGFAIALPAGFEAQVRPRSGLAVRHGVTVLNAPGTIDSDYRGEIRVALVNLGSDPHAIAPGDRIAQLVVARVTRARWAVVRPGSEEQRALAGGRVKTGRGAGGFGHTGPGRPGHGGANG